MKDLKHIRRFNESEENLNISDVSDSISKLSTWYTDIFIDDIKNAKTIYELPHIQTVKRKTGLDNMDLDIAYDRIRTIWKYYH